MKKPSLRLWMTVAVFALFFASGPRGLSGEACSSVIEMDNESFERALEESWSKPVLVVFGTPWCGACKVMEPSVRELAERMGESAIVGKIDAQKNALLADRYGAIGYPSIYVFRDGRVAKKVVGARDVMELEELINAQEGTPRR